MSEKFVGGGAPASTVAVETAIADVETAIAAVETAVEAQIPSSVTTTIQNGVGTAYTGRAKLYWILVVNRYMGEGSCYIIDHASANSGGFRICLKNEVAFMFIANPPMQFNTAIRCSNTTNYGFELVFGYVPD